MSVCTDTVCDMRHARITTAFIPVADPEASAAWYSRAFGFQVQSVTAWSALLRPGEGAGSTALTLLGPASGIRAKPGLEWATCNFAISDLAQARSDLEGHGCAPSAIEGAPEVCLFFTVSDPDGNTVLVTDR
jgi:catechol 2,3-dioxygenase-like lactoylglutathione lyase family enzyme